MTCLVTGGAGYIGGHTVLALLDAGHQVVVLDDLSTGFDWSVPASAPLVVGDVGDFDLVSDTIRTHRVSAIFHFAAKTVVPDSFRDPLGYYLTNAAGTRTLLAAAVHERVRDFVFSSTAAVYGISDLPVSEQQTIDPQSPYGRSKYMAECMIRDAGAAHELRYAVLRYFNVAGADPAGRNGQSTPHATHLIKVAIQAALGKRPCMEIYGADFPTPDGSGIRDYIHVSDLTDAHVLALTRLQSGHASFTANCGYGLGYSVKQVIDVVKAVSGSISRSGLPPAALGTWPRWWQTATCCDRSAGRRALISYRRSSSMPIGGKGGWNGRLVDRGRISSVTPKNAKRRPGANSARNSRLRRERGPANRVAVAGPRPDAVALRRVHAPLNDPASAQHAFR